LGKFIGATGIARNVAEKCINDFNWTYTPIPIFNGKIHLINA